MNLVPESFKVFYNEQLKLYYFIDIALTANSDYTEKGCAVVWPCFWMLSDISWTNAKALTAHVSVDHIMSCAHIVSKLELLVTAGFTIDQAYTLYRDTLKENHIAYVS